MFHAVALETWGSAQEYDQEHGRVKVTARNEDPGETLREVIRRAKAAMAADSRPNLVQASSECADAMEDYLEEVQG